MKKSLFFTLLSAVVCLAACMKEPMEESVPGSQEAPRLQKFSFSSVIEDVKSYFGDPYTDDDKTKYPVLWSGNETQIRVLTSKADVAKNYTSSAVDIQVQPGTKNAWFDYSTELSASNYPVQFFVVSPEAAYNNQSKTNSRVTVDLCSGQTPLANSPDERTQILFAASDSYAEGEIPDRIQLSFHHIPAYLLLSFTNVKKGDFSDALVQSISVTATDSEDNPIGLAGRFYYQTNGTYSSGSNMSNTVTARTSSLDKVWFAVAPVDLSGKKLTFDISTNKGTRSRTVTMPDSRALTSGKIAKLSVNMTGSGSSTADNVLYRKVTNLNTLAANDEIILVSYNGDYALGVTQNSGNRSSAGIIKSGDLVLNPPANVEVLKLESGPSSGQWYLKATKNEGYLYAPNSASGDDNDLKTQASTDASCVWTITHPETYAIENSVQIQRASSPTYHSTIGFNINNFIFAAYNANNVDRFNRNVFIYRKYEPTDLSAELSATSITGDAQDVYLYIYGDTDDWTAEVTSGDAYFVGTASKTYSGSNSSVLTLRVRANVQTSPSRDIIVTVSADGEDDIDLTLTQAIKTATFPIIWTYPTPDNHSGLDWLQYMDWDMVPGGLSGSYVYSDTHEGLLSTVRPSVVTVSNPTYLMKSDVVGADSQRMFLHYGMNSGAYWKFSVYNVQNPAGVYTISYGATSSAHGPKCYILEYALAGSSDADDDLVWTPINAKTETLKYADGTDYGTVTYTYLISPVNNTANEACWVNESFSLDAISPAKNLLIRARVCSEFENAREADMSTVTGGTSRIFGPPVISFEEEIELYQNTPEDPGNWN